MSICTGRKGSIFLLLACQIMAACSPLNGATVTNNVDEVSVSPQTPKMSVDNSLSNCRIRNEIPLDDAETLNLPEVDIQGLFQQDQDLPKDAPLRFANSVQVSIRPMKDGDWTNVDDGMQIWRLRIVSPKALSIGLGFTTFDMPPEGCLFVYSPDHTFVVGPYTSDDSEEHGQLWTPAIEGEEVIVELSMPQGSTSQLQLVLGFVNQGYKK